MKFYSQSPYQYLPYRSIPNYPLRTMTISVGGINFNKDCEYSTEDQELITCLNTYIDIRQGVYCPIRRDRDEISIELVLPTNEPLKEQEEEEQKPDYSEFMEFLRL